MKLSFSSVAEDATALWRAETDLILRIAGVFFFLPALGFGLLLQVSAPLENATPEQLQAAFLASMQANLPWILASTVVQEVGVIAMFLLFLMPGRPRLGEVLARAIKLLPGFLLAATLTSLMMFGGLMLFIVPGLYVQGRTMLAGAAFVADPDKGPLAAIEAGVRLSNRHGWMLFLLWGLISIGAMIVGSVVQGVGDPLVAAAGGNPIVDMLVRIGIAAVGSVAVLLLTLVRIAAYRRLAATPRQGI